MSNWTPSLTMNIDMLDSVENWLDEFIRKSSELVVVQFQPLQTENASKFNLFFIPRCYLVRSSNVGVGISEILRKNKFSPRTYKCKNKGKYKMSPIIIKPKILQVVPKLLKISLFQPASIIRMIKLSKTKIKQNKDDSRRNIVVIEVKGFELV